VRTVGIPRLWAEHTVSEGHTGTSGRQRGFCALGVVSVAGGLAAGGSVPLENLRAVQRKVNRDGDHHSQAVLERHGSRTGKVLASNPGPTSFRSGALPVKMLELVAGRRRLCGDQSPESAPAILPPRPTRSGPTTRPMPSPQFEDRS
jgi:hypothetical protein